MASLNSEIRKINLIFFGGFNYPHGMAGTMRIQHVITGLKAYSDISIRVLVLRQSSHENVLNGVHQGVPYETVMGDLRGAKAALMIPYLYVKSKQIMKRLFHPYQLNILYVYGPPGFDSLFVIRYARSIGFKIVFDIVEDFDLALSISKGIRHKLRIMFIRCMLRQIMFFADGIVVISKYLEKKYNNIISGKIPIYRLPIAVDMDLYPEISPHFGNPIRLFYAGSFGYKDGISVLLDAFDKLATKHKNLHLILTGIGTDEAMQILLNRIESSPYKDRISYKGFLDNALYYEEITSADILCMPRIDIGYAQAGFPFKLGEYLATGKPVIASTVSEIPYLLKDGHDAMLVPPGVSGAIVDAVEMLLNDPKNAFEIGARGRAIAKQLFDYRKQGIALHDFFQRNYG